MAKSAAARLRQLLEEEESLGFIDLMDPEIEYIPPPEEASVVDVAPEPAEPSVPEEKAQPPAPKLEVIINEGPHIRSGYGKPRRVDLRIYDGDPTEQLADDLATLDEDTLREDSDLAVGVLVEEAAGLPEAWAPRDLQEHREAVAGSPQDALQAYFLEGIPRAELEAIPVQAAAILKVRHELFLLESQRWVPACMGEFRDNTLGTLLASMPESEQARLHQAWRAAMRSLSEYFEAGED